MAHEQHERAVALALAANDDLGALFDQLGSADDPQGIYFSYAVFLALLRELWDTPDQALSSLASFERHMQLEIRGIAFSALTFGVSLAQRLLAVHGLVAPQQASTAAIVDAAVDALTAQLHAQTVVVRGAVFTGILSKEEVLGTSDRIGILTPGPIIRETARWIAATSSAVQTQVIDAVLGAARDEWGMQAVSAIDERTTECCLRVHAQVQPLGTPFHLTGEPHYAEEMDAPPFHWYCRTALALVKLEDATDALTRDMVEAAYAEFTARKTRSTATRRVPSSATSRRG